MYNLVAHTWCILTCRNEYVKSVGILSVLVIWGLESRKEMLKTQNTLKLPHQDLYVIFAQLKPTEVNL